MISTILDKDEKRLSVKTIAGYWPLLAEIPNDDKAERIVNRLLDPKFFGAPHPFPSLAVSEAAFEENGCGYRSDHNNGNLWEAYLPTKEGHGKLNFPRPHYLTFAALSTICLTIENIVELVISLPRKTVDWIIPNLEIMGVENLSLKKNMITIVSNKSERGWKSTWKERSFTIFSFKAEPRYSRNGGIRNEARGNSPAFLTVLLPPTKKPPASWGLFALPPADPPDPPIKSAADAGGGLPDAKAGRGDYSASKA